MKFNYDINWKFIAELEGELINRGYVPRSGHSGVTIASGFDIGQHSIQDLVDMKLPNSLINKLVPYTERKDNDAVKALSQTPLFLSKEEVLILDKAVKEKYSKQVADEFDLRSKVKFKNLEEAKQTVICSVAFQYGSLQRRCPTFYSLITKGLWKAAIAELEDFKDAYRSRRLKEAKYLKDSLYNRKEIT